MPLECCMSILTSPIPTWCELLALKKKSNACYWRDVIWTNKTATSIRLIAEETRKQREKDQVVIWIPNLFCGETEELFDCKEIHIIHYPITEALDPDWDCIKNKNYKLPDIFVLVHYFGEYHNTDRTKSFCSNNNAIFVEDCAHCLFDYQGHGRTGDFSLFSCHKLLPVPDGAIIRINNPEKAEVFSIASSIKSRLASNSKRMGTFFWRLKKVAQRIIKKNAPYNYERKTHYYSSIVGAKNKSIHNISSYSKKVISGYSYEDLKAIAYIRKENCSLVYDIVKRIDSGIKLVLTEECECPYFAVISIADVQDKNAIVHRIKELGLPMMYWPDLPSSIEYEEDSLVARHLSADIIAFPVHQSIKPSAIARLASYNTKLDTDLRLEMIDSAKRIRWEKIYNEISVSNITQHWAYGDVKNYTEGWHVERFVINENQKDIGVLQVLSKTILGRGVVYRVNKGPLLVDGKNDICHELATIDMFWRRIKRPAVLLYVPYTKMTPANYISVISSKWKNWNCFGFPTGIIDLRKTEEEIRQTLNGKWRNQLKSAEKNCLIIKTDDSRFQEMLRLYENEQQDKKFKGVRSSMLTAMNNHPDNPLRFFYIEGEEKELLAFDIIYRHGTTATYYIGWNSTDGRKQYLNNLLLYQSAIRLKQEGARVFDLGGIDYINTESIAKFKDGMSPFHFRQMGEFIKVK